MKNVAYIFPGQGAQYVGMGKDFYEKSPASKEIFDEAEKILPEVNIKRLCFECPIEELTETKNSQVAILVTSIAALKAFNSYLPSPISHLNITACAGLSLGELTALVAAKAIDFKDAVRLVRRRGELMEEAAIKNPGMMASVIGLSVETLEEICKDTGCQIANLNCPGQIVISGTKESVENTIEAAKDRGAKKCIPLNVSGAFHSSLMNEAADKFKIELKDVEFRVPEIGIVSNVTKDYVKTPDEIRENLVKQLYSPVLWEDSIRKIASEGIDTFFEIGPGKVLKGLLRRIDANLKVFNIERMEDIERLVISDQ